MKLVLFDIDGTLIRTGGAGTAAMNMAFSDIYGVNDAFTGIKMAGKMDPAILSEALTAAGIGKGCDDGFWEIYVRHLARELKQKTDKGRVMPGVRELLDELANAAGFVSGLLTGNHEQGAKIKLDHFGLSAYFCIGAFGNDSERREDLVKIATDRLFEETGARAAGRDVVVVGDTPRDIKCASANGAISIAVATGPYSAAELASESPDFVFETLADTASVMGAMKA